MMNVRDLQRASVATVTVIRWGFLIIFFGSVVTGQWTLTLVSSIVLLAFVALEVYVRIGSPDEMRDLLHDSAWGALGGILFVSCYLGFPVLFLMVFRNWSPTIPREAVLFLFYAPGPILGIAAWVAVLRYSGRCRKPAASPR